jgi:hypothetical protein
MHPFEIPMTAISLCSLRCERPDGHHAMLIGAGTFTIRPTPSGHVKYDSAAFITRPEADHTELLMWLADRLGHSEGGIIGYELSNTTVPILIAFATDLSPEDACHFISALAVVASSGSIDLADQFLDARAYVAFAAKYGFLAEREDSDRVITKWLKNDTDQLAETLVSDAIMAWQVSVADDGRTAHEALAIGDQALNRWRQKVGR